MAMNLTKSQIRKMNTLAQHMITRCKISTPKVLLNLLLNMLPLENKLESIALKRAITLKTEGHWNTKRTKTKNTKQLKKNRLDAKRIHQNQSKSDYRQDSTRLDTKQKMKLDKQDME